MCLVKLLFHIPKDVHLLSDFRNQKYFPLFLSWKSLFQDNKIRPVAQWAILALVLIMLGENWFEFVEMVSEVLDRCLLSSSFTAL
jgi:hypothetical protein